MTLTYLMIIPDLNPRKLLVVGNQVQVSTVSRNSPSVVVEAGQRQYNPTTMMMDEGQHT